MPKLDAHDAHEILKFHYVPDNEFKEQMTL